MILGDTSCLPVRTSSPLIGGFQLPIGCALDQFYITNFYLQDSLWAVMIILKLGFFKFEVPTWLASSDSGSRNNLSLNHSG